MANGLVPDIGFQLGRGVQTFGQLQQQQLLREQAAAQAAQQQQLQGLLGQITPGQQPVSQLGVQAPVVQPQAVPQQLGVQPAVAPQAVPTTQPAITQQQARQQLETFFPQQAQQIAAAQKASFENRTAREKQRITSVVQSAAGIQGLPVEQQIRKLEQNRERFISQNIPTNDTDEQLRLLRAGRIDEANVLTDQAVQLGQSLGILKGADVGLTAAQREFESLTAGLTEEQKLQARLIDLGLTPRAVGSAIQTISAEGIAEQIGDAEATIKERAKFGELTGASRSKAIDSGFARIVSIDKNIINLDKAIAAVEAGAGTGAIERRFPSIRAASVELDQIQGELALDVIGSVTFGALSEGELNLAKQIALPTGLEGPQLIQHLRDRKAAQEKLRSYFREQIDFLDQGGTIAGFLRNKERQTQTGGTGGATQVGRFTVEVVQ